MTKDQNMGRTCCAHKLYFVFVLTFRTIYAHNMFSPCSELVVFMYCTGKSMNNLLSYCGLVDPRISASDKDLPVLIQTSSIFTKIISEGFGFIKYFSCNYFLRANQNQAKNCCQVDWIFRPTILFGGLPFPSVEMCEITPCLKFLT
jgi:hypothetical protein